MKQIFHISWIAMRELIYERVFYLLFSFVALAVVLGVLLGRLTFGEQAKLTLDFMLGALHIALVLFSIFMGISLFQRELLMGSISMLLSKPVSRTSFLLGKYLGQVAIQLGVVAAMCLVVMVTCLRFEEISFVAIAQAVLFIFFETCVLTAITYFFSVNAGSLTAALATFAFFILGHFNTSSNQATGYQIKSVSPLIATLIPDLEVFNLKTFASYGVTISNQEMGLGLAYAILCAGLFLVLASLTFEQKDILT